MYVAYHTLPDTAKVWVFVSDRILSESDVASMNHSCKNFIDKWHSHNKDVYGSFTLLHNCIIIIAANDGITDVSGCSKDSLVHFMQDMQKHLHLNFFDRKIVVIKKEEDIILTNIDNLKNLPNPNDYEVLNPMVSKKSDTLFSFLKESKYKIFL